MAKTKTNTRRDKLHGRIQISFPLKGKTKQWHKKECDINEIMAKYQNTGILEHINKHEAQYGFATSEDLHESLNMIHKAQAMFDDLPSKARAKFNNDPGTFLDFVQDPENETEFYELGLSDYPVPNPDENIENNPVTPEKASAEN